jgi:uncharacterized membrane protein YkvA (DUF1232 family)
MSESKNKEPKGFQKAYRQAEKLTEDRNALQKLIDKASNKAVDYKDRLKEVWAEVQIFFRMLKAWKDGKHKLELKTGLSIIAAIIYFVNPFDIIPDFIPALGLIDDITIITYVITRFEKEIERFSAWEKESAVTEDKSSEASDDL